MEKPARPKNLKIERIIVLILLFRKVKMFWHQNPNKMINFVIACYTTAGRNFNWLILSFVLSLPRWKKKRSIHNIQLTLPKEIHRDDDKLSNKRNHVYTTRNIRCNTLPSNIHKNKASWLSQTEKHCKTINFPRRKGPLLFFLKISRFKGRLIEQNNFSTLLNNWGSCY